MIINSSFSDFYDKAVPLSKRDKRVVFAREQRMELPLPGCDLGDFTRRSIAIQRGDAGRFVGLVLLAGRVFPFGATHVRGGWAHDFVAPYDAFADYDRLVGDVPRVDAGGRVKIAAATALNKAISPVLILWPSARGPIILVNPRLQDYNFPLPAEDVFQRIYLFLSRHGKPLAQQKTAYGRRRDLALAR